MWGEIHYLVLGVAEPPSPSSAATYVSCFSAHLGSSTDAEHSVNLLPVTGSEG
jgi:hypothetical protein